MKIDEFIEKVNDYDSLSADVDNDGTINIYSIDEDVIMTIPRNAESILDINYWIPKLDEFLFKSDKKFLVSVIFRLLTTPVKERFPEKKYRLRWIDDDESAVNYLGVINGVWDLNYKVTTDNGTVFTEKELQQLKINHPRFAPAIDAMKEPAEE